MSFGMPGERVQAEKILQPRQLFAAFLDSPDTFRIGNATAGRW
jgi:hypothetical protein